MTSPQLDSRSQSTWSAFIQLCERPAAISPGGREGMLEVYMATKAEVWAVPVSSWMPWGITPSHSKAHALERCEHSANLSNTDTLSLLCFRSLWVEVSKEVSALYAEHDTIWDGISPESVVVSCPGHVPSQILVHPSLLTVGMRWEAEKPWLCFNVA